MCVCECVHVSVCAAAAYKAINNPRIFNSLLETEHETMSWFIHQLSLLIRQREELRMSKREREKDVGIFAQSQNT